MPTMEKLFSPFTVKNIRLKNRIVMPPLASFLIGNDGSITGATIEPVSYTHLRAHETF